MCIMVLGTANIHLCSGVSCIKATDVKHKLGKPMDFSFSSLSLIFRIVIRVSGYFLKFRSKAQVILSKHIQEILALYDFTQHGFS